MKVVKFLTHVKVKAKLLVKANLRNDKISWVWLKPLLMTNTNGKGLSVSCVEFVRVYSVETFVVPCDFPFDELLQLVRRVDQMFVLLYALICSYDAQVYARWINLSGHFEFALSKQIEVRLQIIGRLFCLATLVVQDAQFEGCFGLHMRIWHVCRQTCQLVQMGNGVVYTTLHFRVRFS